MLDRRQFISGSALALSCAALQTGAYAAAADKKYRVGLIGTGWYGKCDLLRLVQVSPIEVVSLCDVDQVMLNEAAELVATRQVNKKQPRQYGDYRKMLAEKDLDIVLVGTPDHWHALHAIAAMEAGADLYVQKPISVDVVEGEAMLAAARRMNRVVQVGTQRRSTPHLVDAVNKVIRPGKLGKIGMVEIYCYYHMRNKSNPPTEQPPATFDYEMWTGPAPLRPYSKLIHPQSWRAFMEYGNGIIGDMCIHMLDTVRWMLDLGWPTRINSNGGILVDKQAQANITDTQTATFEFPEFPVVWTHRTWGDTPDPEYPWGITIYGEQGTLKASVHKYDFIPRGKGSEKIHQDVKLELEQYPEDKTEKKLEQHVAPAIRAHMLDFLQAIQNRTQPVADIEQGHISSASCILANVSQKLGRSLVYNPETKQVTNDVEATQLLRRPYRAPWKHPEPSDFK